MAYKALKAARGVPGGRDATRMMQKMGMKVDAIPDVSEVIIRTPSREIVIDAPAVTIVTVQGQTMYQIAGGEVSEAASQATALPTVPDADVQIVAQQSGKSMEEARRALTDAQGDLAKAILLLKGESS